MYTITMIPLRSSVSLLRSAFLRPLALAAPRRLFSAAASTSPAASKHSFNSRLPLPHGPTGQLISCLFTGPSLLALKSESLLLPSLVLSRRQLCDLELIMNGGFSPLNGFVGQQDYYSILNNTTLSNKQKTLFPIPIYLDVSAKFVQSLIANNKNNNNNVNNHDDHILDTIPINPAHPLSVSLKDEEGNILAVLRVSSIYKLNKSLEGQALYKGDHEHPAMAALAHAGPYALGGSVDGIQLPIHYDYKDIRLSPVELRQYFHSHWADSDVVAFQTRNPIHRAHYELTQRARAAVDNGRLLLHPVVGMTKHGDIDHHTRVKCYREILPYYPPGTVKLAALPLAMRMGGPREAILHAIIRQNYGATHFILGRDHAGPGSNSSGQPFYGPYEARDAALKYSDQLNIRLLPFEQMVYLPSQRSYSAVDRVPSGVPSESLSGTELRRLLRCGLPIPEWFSFPRVVTILQQAHPPLHQQGLCLFMTGLSGSGKTAVANALIERLMEIQNRKVVLLDGDHVRHMLSSELTFSKDHRQLNIKRIGYVASLITKCGGLVIAAPIAPYSESRAYARSLVEASTSRESFVEIFISTPLAVCERRDRKGLYAKARAGLLKQMTGIDDPYERPEKAEIEINTDNVSIEQAVQKIVDYLKNKGFIQEAVTQPGEEKVHQEK